MIKHGFTLSVLSASMRALFSHSEGSICCLLSPMKTLAIRPAIRSKGSRFFMNVITSVVMEWMLPFGCTELGSFLISSMMSFSVLEHWQKKRVAFSYLVERFVVVHKCKVLDILKKNIPKKILKKRLKNMKKKEKKSDLTLY